MVLSEATAAKSTFLKKIHFPRPSESSQYSRKCLDAQECNDNPSKHRTLVRQTALPGLTL
jgi:hypothetical protein